MMLTVVSPQKLSRTVHMTVARVKAELVEKLGQGEMKCWRRDDGNEMMLTALASRKLNVHITVNEYIAISSERRAS